MVEVMFGIATFSLISILAATIMNLGISTSQANLEQTMARELINAQAEAIRYIHDAYITERKNPTGNQEYYELWQKISKTASSAFPLQVSNCAERYNGVNSGSIFTSNSFIINTRNIDPQNPEKTVFSTSANTGVFKQSSLQPRLIYEVNSATTDEVNISETVDPSNPSKHYTSLKTAEGIWVTAVASGEAIDGKPEFYDYYIQTCWNGPNQSYPTTIGTVIRLYNPDFVGWGI